MTNSDRVRPKTKTNRSKNSLTKEDFEKINKEILVEEEPPKVDFDQVVTVEPQWKKYYEDAILYPE